MAAVPPTVALVQIDTAVQEQFGLVGDYAPLVSERDQNFHLKTASGDEYVVKVTSSAEPEIVSAFQIAALRHLQGSGLKVPKVIDTAAGEHSGHVSEGGCEYRLRVVSYLPGVQLASVSVDRHMAYEFGAELARLDAGLAPFSHPGDRPVLLWDLQRAGELRGLLEHIDEPATRQSVARALDDFETVIAPALVKLRTQVIHGDANPGNVLVDPIKRRVAGFIDVGDMVRAPLVFDMAIAASYLRGEDANPLECMAPFCAGYNAVLPLQDAEKALLFDLVRARLATTITLLFWRLSARGDDDPYRKKTLREEADAMRFLDALDALGRDGFAQQIAHAA